MSLLRRFYFQWSTRHALGKADAVVTISEFSKQALSRVSPRDARKIRTVYPGPGLNCREISLHPTTTANNTVTIIGSFRPHKATEETLQLLDMFAQKKQIRIEVNVASIDHPLPQWKALSKMLTVNYLGRIPDGQLSDRIADSRALVYLSKLEGFGLPCIEAYECGTPVCFRNSTSLKEILHGIPGAWDGTSFESFQTAMEQAWNMPDEDIRKYRELLASRFNWNRAASETVSLYRETMAPQRGRFGIFECSTHDIPELLDEVRELIMDRKANPRTITCLNAHIYNLASENAQLGRDILNSRIIAADGMSIVWAAKLTSQGGPASRCNMTDAFAEFLHCDNFPKSRAILIGLKKESAEQAANRINAISKHCRVVTFLDGYLTYTEYREALRSKSDLDLVLVGMGSPRSERVCQIAAEVVPEAVVWHIGGGTLELFAGKTKPAPEWMKKTGLQWLFRLLLNPRYFCGRYLIGNPAFVLRFLRDTVTQRQP